MELQLCPLQTHCKAAEHKRCDTLSDQLPPGTKIQLRGCPIRMGVMLLEPKCIKVRRLPGGCCQGGEAYCRVDLQCVGSDNRSWLG